jgi:hypothetical protein
LNNIVIILSNHRRIKQLVFTKEYYLLIKSFTNVYEIQLSTNTKNIPLKNFSHFKFLFENLLFLDLSCIYILDLAIAGNKF